MQNKPSTTTLFCFRASIDNIPHCAIVSTLLDSCRIFRLVGPGGHAESSTAGDFVLRLEILRTSKKLSKNNQDKM
jgi:hypothetical protein